MSCSSTPSLAAPDSLILLTHDVDANDAYNEGPWGEPGALQMAALEKRYGIRATYNFTTDYISGYYRPEVVEKVCADGLCPAGAHSVQHLSTFREHPLGTCKETRETYTGKTPPTLCAEVRIALDLLTAASGARPRAWRSPYLANNPLLFDVLAEEGVTLDSSFGVGDLKYNLPVDTAVTPKLQHLFHHRRLFEFPIAGEDGRIVNHERMEVQANNLPWFVNAWEYTALRNAQNESITTILVHPTRGHRVADDNIKTKIAAVDHLIQFARPSHRLRFPRSLRRLLACALEGHFRRKLRRSRRVYRLRSDRRRSGGGSHARVRGRDRHISLQRLRKGRGDGQAGRSAREA